MSELSKHKFTINVEEVEVLLDLDPGTLVGCLHPRQKR
jgi:hypothetical protein